MQATRHAPPSFGDLNNLQLLDLTYRQLLTSLPVGFCKLSNLQALSRSETCTANVKKLKLALGGGNREISVEINCCLWVGEGMVQRQQDREPFSKHLITACSVKCYLHCISASPARQAHLIYSSNGDFLGVKLCVTGRALSRLHQLLTMRE